MIETKVAAGSFAGILTGLITWALAAYVPAFRSGLPPAVAALIPVAAAWLAHSAAGYLAPHTPRAGTVTNVPASGIPQRAGYSPASGPAEPPQPPVGPAGASA